MHIPVPNNRLVAFTLVGALLTALVAGGLAFPGLGFGPVESPNEAIGTETDVSQQVAADAPEPNQDFTPAVQTQSGYEEEHEEYEDDEEEYEEEHEEEYEDDEYEDGEKGEYEHDEEYD